MKNPAKKVQILTLGDGSVGKTSLLKRYLVFVTLLDTTMTRSPTIT